MQDNYYENNNEINWVDLIMQLEEIEKRLGLNEG